MKTVLAATAQPHLPAERLRSGGRRAAKRERRREVLATAADDLPQGLAASFWFDSGSGSAPYAATVRFSGRRAGASGRLGPADSFVRDEAINEVIPGAGPVAITARIADLNPGEWALAAELLQPAGAVTPADNHLRAAQHGNAHLRPAGWSWQHWALYPASVRTVRTRWAPLTTFLGAPAVIPGSWAALVLLGVVAGLALQAVLVGRAHLNVGRVLAVGVVAAVVGLIGAKAWYVALNRKAWRESLQVGLCIQGFLVGALVSGVAGLLLLHLPVGTVLDATAPGLFLGITIGRFGCFLTGCCAGRQSASRWAIWSSDGRVGARRIPTQLLESGAALTIAGASLLVQMSSRAALPGAIFVSAFAAYTLWRQGLLRLRSEARRSRLGGPITAVAAVIVLLGSLSALLVRFAVAAA